MTLRPLFTLLGVILLLGVAGCQRPDALRTTPAETDVQPRQVSQAGGGTFRGRPVAWGGSLIAVENLSDRTRLELLAFPLDRDGAPRTGSDPTGRFVAEFQGFLDPADYAPGRSVTVRGVLAGIYRGKVGEADYDFPVVEAGEARLWPRSGDGYGAWPPQLHIGIGVYGGF